jgi:hypothetical protein
MILLIKYHLRRDDEIRSFNRPTRSLHRRIRTPETKLNAGFRVLFTRYKARLCHALRNPDGEDVEQGSCRERSTTVRLKCDNIHSPCRVISEFVTREEFSWNVVGRRLYVA